MLNLVEKFTPEAVEATDEDGVVAIEYVLLAGRSSWPSSSLSTSPSAAWPTSWTASSRRVHLTLDRRGGRATSPSSHSDSAMRLSSRSPP